MTGHRTRLSVAVALLVLLALALPSVYAAQPGVLSAATGVAQAPQPAVAQQTKVFLPLVGSQASSNPGQLSVRFWAERYTMEAGQCTPMHWKVSGAKAVLLDNAAVAATGVTNACPGLSQFYTLQVDENGGNVTEYQLTLWAGHPDLQTGQVIAQAVVQSVTPVADLEPQTAGNQAGYQVQLTNVAKLYSKDTSWNQSAVTLAVPQSLIDYGFSGPVHWPVKAGQAVEFRANCDGAACTVVDAVPSYLYLRSE